LTPQRSPASMVSGSQSDAPTMTLILRWLDPNARRGSCPTLAAAAWSASAALCAEAGEAPRERPHPAASAPVEACKNSRRSIPCLGFGRDMSTLLFTFLRKSPTS
jgi:hypothetical protein